MSSSPFDYLISKITGIYNRQETVRVQQQLRENRFATLRDYLADEGECLLYGIGEGDYAGFIYHFRAPTGTDPRSGGWEMVEFNCSTGYACYESGEDVVPFDRIPNTIDPPYESTLANDGAVIAFFPMNEASGSTVANNTIVGQNDGTYEDLSAGPAISGGDWGPNTALYSGGGPGMRFGVQNTQGSQQHDVFQGVDYGPSNAFGPLTTDLTPPKPAGLDAFTIGAWIRYGANEAGGDIFDTHGMVLRIHHSPSGGPRRVHWVLGIHSNSNGYEYPQVHSSAVIGGYYPAC